MTDETLLGCPSCGAAPLHNLSKGWRDQLHGELHQDHILRCPHGCFKASRSTYESTVAEWQSRALGPALDTVIEAVEAGSLSAESVERFRIEMSGAYWTDEEMLADFVAALRALRAEQHSASGARGGGEREGGS